MEKDETKKEVVVLRVDRRARKREELSCAEIVRLARKRGSKARGGCEAEFTVVAENDRS